MEEGSTTEEEDAAVVEEVANADADEAASAEEGATMKVPDEDFHQEGVHIAPVLVDAE